MVGTQFPASVLCCHLVFNRLNGIGRNFGFECLKALCEICPTTSVLMRHLYCLRILLQIKERYQKGRSVKWWHPIFYFLIDLGIVNSFILWQVSKRNRNLDQLTFRIALACQLIDGYSSRKRKGRPASFQAKKCAVPDDVPLARVGNHMSKMVSNYRRCRKCSTKADEKRICCICAECDAPLCIGTCFLSFHAK
ncbi:piggyBac transposable element-derived protein 4 [Trichonephila clavipes]|nr:piggyBac transposable element-derived protein 4 [Trichonephila clavipes]